MQEQEACHGKSPLVRDDRDIVSTRAQEVISGKVDFAVGSLQVGLASDILESLHHNGG